MFITTFLILSISMTAFAFPTPQQTLQQYPATQEVKQSQLSAHHGYVYGPQQQAAQLSQYPTTQPTVASTSSPITAQKSAQMLMSDPDFQMLARSLHTGTGSVGFNNPIVARELPPCSSDGRSVTIDHLRISPESLVQIARLAQAFGTNPDWKKLRLAEMKSALNSQMHSTHQYAARSIGL